MAHPKQPNRQRRQGHQPRSGSDFREDQRPDSFSHQQELDAEASMLQPLHQVGL